MIFLLASAIMERVKIQVYFDREKGKQEHSGSLRTQEHTSEEGSKWGHLWGQTDQFHHLTSCLGQQRATCIVKAEEALLSSHITSKGKMKYTQLPETPIETRPPPPPITEKEQQPH